MKLTIANIVRMYLFHVDKLRINDIPVHSLSSRIFELEVLDLTYLRFFEVGEVVHWYIVGLSLVAG